MTITRSSIRNYKKNTHVLNSELNMAPRLNIVEIGANGNSRVDASTVPPVTQPNETPSHNLSCTTSSSDNIHQMDCSAPISRLRVEKIEGGLMVAGVVIAANCQIILPVFGFLFTFIGCVLTAASYRGPAVDEGPDSYAERIALTGNSRILGPACIVIGLLMFASGIGLCIMMRRARQHDQHVGFHCPVHGDFYPLSPNQNSKSFATIERNHDNWWLHCCKRGSRMSTVHVAPPQCPHSQVSSTRSSLSSAPPISHCPTPLPFLVTSRSIGGLVPLAAQLSPDQTFGSIRSLAVTRDIASFPMSPTPSPPQTPISHEKEVILKSGELLYSLVIEAVQRLLSSPPLTPMHEYTAVEINHDTNDSDTVYPRETARKSVSIVLPEEDKG